MPNPSNITLAAPGPPNQAHSPSVILPVDPDAKSTLDEALGSLSVSDNEIWPKEWKDDDENPGYNLDKFLADMRRREAYYDSLGVPCSRVTTDTHGNTTLQPRQWVSLEAADFTGLEDNLDTEYIALTREVPADQLGKATDYKMVGNSRQGMEMTTVPKAEHYRDRRTVERPVDVVSYDQPAADTMRYLEHGNNFISSAMTKDNWRPGQLIGQNGSDPATIAQSPSFLPPDRHDDMSERRSATSTGHILQHRRPAGVGLGWGDYDRHVRWQSYGRRVTKDMVEKQNWQTDLLAPSRFFNESGEVVKTVTKPFERRDLPSQPQKPVSLYDRLNPRDGRTPEAPAEKNSETPAWPGTYNDDE
ncbi:hypothetical protein HRG_008183 [Hirsutella rhossiliensis]|uniref:Uncharacterized protein n=1 Tax=Hirsutella rhossiliensis TaxID=111463 RepID=A0A9P8MTK2_9HYPO|nr:uncharacterized protein HRG_08183 [Hirsutella rhossiliensis]KAH0961030.1 hypothetical protein HRG_08183 [Hirsutella rhossiliensis]